jgi:hypothetical protein
MFASARVLTVVLILFVPALAEDEPKWTELFDGKTLAGWKETKFGTGGQIEAIDGRIVLNMGDGCTGITIDGEFPTMDYEVSLEAMRVEGGDFFCGMTFPVGESPCSFIVGGWGGPVVGLSSIDGEDASRNETTKRMKFKTGEWYPIRLKVTKEKIEAWIDKEQVVDFKTEGKKLTIRPEVALSKPFGLCAYSTTAALKNIKVRKLKP